MLGQTGRRFGCFKHRGGPSQINSRRIPALPRPSARLSTGTRHSTGYRAEPHL